MNILGIGLLVIFSNAVLFGGLAFLGTVAGCDSRTGQTFGLIIFLITLFLRFPNSLNPYRITEAMAFPTIWFSARLAYSLMGIGCLAVSINWLQDTDRLITGNRVYSTWVTIDQSKRRKKRLKAFSFLKKPVLTLPNSLSGIIAYEALLLIIQGAIPVFIIIICLVFGIILPLLDFTRGFDFTALIDTVVNSFPRALIYFLFPLLPPLLTHNIPRDRHSNLDQSILATIPHRKYLTGKVLGACVAVILMIMVGNIPVLLFLGITAFTSSTTIIASYLGSMIFGLLPAMIYISVLSVLGSAVLNRPYLLGGLLFIGNIGLLIFTSQSVIANIIFPTGLMAIETIGELFRHPHGINYSSSLANATIVPVSFLLFPLLSLAAQTALALNIVSKYFELEITKK